MQLQTIFTDVLQTCLKVSLHNSKDHLNCFSVVEQSTFSNGTWIDTTPKQWYNHCAQIELLLEKHFQKLKLNTKPLCILFILRENIDKSQKYVINFMKNNLMILHWWFDVRRTVRRLSYEFRFLNCFYVWEIN